MPPAAGREHCGSDPEPSRPGELGELVARVADQPVGGAEQRRRLAELSRALAASARSAGVGAVVGGRWLTDVVTGAVTDTVPRLLIRDQATLRGHHPGRPDDEVARALVRTASLATAGVGAAAGALAAVEFAAPPALLAAPLQLAAESLVVSAVEIKLVAELHELFGEPAGGGRASRSAAYLMSWVHQRAVDPIVTGGVGAVLGQAAKRELRGRIIRRLGRSATSLAPFLAGAVAGSEVNRRATRALGGKLAAELRARRDG
ncbi:MAG TPA: hypothetical protein VFX70_00940 [Mycobacteriales bacterium]|nr:hypothetical protein [Mycobacteriales bacterium]